MSGYVALQHQVIGVQHAKQGAGQAVPEDLVLCIECGWMRVSEYAHHLDDRITDLNARIASEAAERALREFADTWRRGDSNPWALHVKTVVKRRADRLANEREGLS